MPFMEIQWTMSKSSFLGKPTIKEQKNSNFEVPKFQEYLDYEWQLKNDISAKINELKDVQKDRGLEVKLKLVTLKYKCPQDGSNPFIFKKKESK